jgi:hypothetical protein
LSQGYISFVFKAHSNLSRCVFEEVFDRYNIVSDADLRLATQLQEAFLKSAADTISGTIADFEQ